MRCPRELPLPGPASPAGHRGPQGARVNEVPNPIICGPYDEPSRHWHIVEGEPLDERAGRRDSVYFYRPPKATPTAQTGEAGTPIRLELVNELRGRVKRWREAGYPGVTRTTLDLLRWWNRDGRFARFFFAQLEAAETVIFLTEARQDFRQGIQVPRDDPSPERLAEGYSGFTRYAAKMATGTGKTTVMGMLAAWSILNKRANRQDARFSEVVLVVCPNVTIRDRLQELHPERGDASIYRTRDIVSEALMPQLRQGSVIVTNWHGFKPKNLSGTNRVDRRGLESDTAVVARVLGKGGKRNVLVLNDEAHHAYRVIPEEGDTMQASLLDDEDDPEGWREEATIWIDGLDRIQRIRGINLCIDLSATPYYLDRVGQDANTPFPWVVSDFSLVDAIESGLVKIPQLAVRDTTGAPQAAYFNIWKWILPQLTASERGGRRAVPKPEAILKFAHTPIAILAGQYRDVFEQWQKDGAATPPVFIIVCKNTRLSQVIFEWITGQPVAAGIPPADLPLFRNDSSATNTIRVDSKVIEETDQEGGKDENRRWMRFTLDTVGKTEWSVDNQGSVIYPDGFEELAKKLDRPKHPPGRDVRCIISVGMLTEGWDCRTVTHILGLRPFESQLLCEQVVGRGLRRSSYEVGDDGLMTEEVSEVLGVPFEIVPFKKTGSRGTAPKTPRHVRAMEDRAQYEIRFPRVDGYTSAPRARITVNWEQLPVAHLQPGTIPPEYQMKALLPNNVGRQTLSGPGRISQADLDGWRRDHRIQRLEFELAAALTRDLAAAGRVPAHALFAQLQPIVSQFLRDKVRAEGGSNVKDIFLSPYYGWAIERLAEAIRPDDSEAPEIPRYESHRGPGSSGDVDYWTTKPESRLRVAERTHINFVVADTDRWEEQAAYYLDNHENVDAFVKNAGLGFAVPYLHNGEQHDFEVDYLVRLRVGDRIVGHLLLEPKGHDPRAEIKAAAANRWCDAVTAEGSYGPWTFAMVRESMAKVPAAVSDAAAALAGASDA